MEQAWFDTCHPPTSSSPLRQRGGKAGRPWRMASSHCTVGLGRRHRSKPSWVYNGLRPGQGTIIPWPGEPWNTNRYSWQFSRWLWAGDLDVTAPKDSPFMQPAFLLWKFILTQVGTFTVHDIENRYLFLWTSQIVMEPPPWGPEEDSNFRVVPYKREMDRRESWKAFVSGLWLQVENSDFLFGTGWPERKKTCAPAGMTSYMTPKRLSS